MIKKPEKKKWLGNMHSIERKNVHVWNQAITEYEAFHRQEMDVAIKYIESLEEKDHNRFRAMVTYWLNVSKLIVALKIKIKKNQK